jgi:gluconate 5-dehydrogenase
MSASASIADLRGVRALVTGGTSGLGQSMAEALMLAGAQTVVTSRDRDRAEESAKQLGASALGMAMDVRHDDAVHAGVDEIYARLGGLDVLVNNAGIGMRTVNPRFLTEPQPFWAISPEGFRDVVDTKLTGSFLVARVVVPRMLQSGGGRVVMISMNTETMTRRGFVPYGPSGAGVEALARVMAADLTGTTVTVNILLPGGATATGMVPEYVSDEARPRLLDPAIMGPPIVWLASPQAAAAHGERIVAADFKEWLQSTLHNVIAMRRVGRRPSTKSEDAEGYLALCRSRDRDSSDG